MSEQPLASANDPSGLVTLERFAEAQNFNSWLFDTIEPYCRGHVLEVGSGIGNLTKKFLEKSIKITASDLRPEYIEYLKNKFSSNPLLKDILLLNLENENIPPEFENSFDSIVALNVIEHIENATLAIRNCTRMLKSGGQLTILVPAFQCLYNNFDKELGHHIRYTAKSLKTLLANGGLQVSHTEYFNLMGILGWWVNGSLLNKSLIPGKQLQLYNKIIPAAKHFDKLFFRSIGLSVIAIGKKP